MGSNSQPCNRRTVWAAGGVLWRVRAQAVAGDAPNSGIEVGLIHRPRYDDWTLPKGKAEDGETIFSAAQREIYEETGYRTVLGRHVAKVVYDLNAHTTKKVHYWSAAAVGGDFSPNNEVDQFAWFDIDKALRRLTYGTDRKVLTRFAALPVRSHTFLLVRHAKAGQRSKYRGDDRLRPLDRAGRAQADALVPLLGSFGAQALHAADRVRCTQTLAPLAAHLDTEIEIEKALTEEAYRSDDDRAHARLLELAADDRLVHAVCSQGKVIPPAMRWWTQRAGIPLAPNRNRKGSVWVLSMYDGRLVAADHIADPLPRDWR